MISVDHPAADAGLPPAPPGSPLDVIEVASAVLVRNFELLRRRRPERDLDRSEYLLLRTLDAAGPADICTLAGALGLDPSTAGRQVTVLANKGLVRRAPAESDRRRSMISPTGEGLGRMRAERERRRRDTAELLADWTDEDLRTLGEMFTRYNRAVAGRYLGGPGPADAGPPAVVGEA